MSISIEVVVQTPQDAILATEAGASRLELVSAIEVGGLTPTLGVVREVRKATHLPIRVMIRPTGNGFVYPSSLHQAMLYDIQSFREEGINGFVFGCLTQDFQLNRDQNLRLIEAAKGLGCTLHRASDVLLKSGESLESLQGLGFDAVLTTGGTGSALNSTEKLKQVITDTLGQVEVLVCGWIRAENVKQVVQATTCKWVHLGQFVPPTPIHLGRNHDFELLAGSIDQEEIRQVCTAVARSEL